jgi:hypothetical protein
VLVDVVLHFPELDADLEVLGSKHSVELIDNEVDALWSHMCVAADSLSSHVPSAVACNPPNGAGE